MKPNIALAMAAIHTDPITWAKSPATNPIGMAIIKPIKIRREEYPNKNMNNNAMIKPSINAAIIPMTNEGCSHEAKHEGHIPAKGSFSLLAVNALRKPTINPIQAHNRDILLAIS
jgi:hypothetical protein